MNAKDQAAMNEVIAALKSEFTAALAPLVSEVLELQQRSSNFAARVNATNKVYREEIARLRDEVAALTPAKPVAAAPRLTDAQWNAAMACLRKAHPGKTFFAPGVVRATATEMQEHAHARRSGQCDAGSPPDEYMQACLDAEEEVSL